MPTQAPVLSLLAFDAADQALALDGDWPGEPPLVSIELSPAEMSLPLIAPPRVVEDQASALRRLRSATDRAAHRRVA